MTSNHHTSSVPPQLELSWRLALQEEFQKAYMKELRAFIAQERAGSEPVFPPARDVFNAFSLTPLEKVKVVIVGQDPYHGLGQAHGLCFSVQEGIAIPPSLQNIFRELKDDLGIEVPGHGCLTAWARQGVLLLNAVLTVRQGKPLSHQGKGWEIFTDAVLKMLALRSDPLVFLLWGKSAQQKCQQLIPEIFQESTASAFTHPGSGFLNHFNHLSHLILKAPHPSPLSAHAGFFGCRHFSKANAFLTASGKSPIDWDLMHFQP